MEYGDIELEDEIVEYGETEESLFWIIAIFVLFSYVLFSWCSLLVFPGGVSL